MGTAEPPRRVALSAQSVLSVIVAALLVCVLIPRSAAARDIRFGMAATDGVKHYLEKSIPLGVDNHAVFYFHVGKSSELTYSSLPSDVDVTLAVKFSGSGGVYNQILAGEYDERLDALVGKIKAADRPLTLRIMPEFNGDWNPDGAYTEWNRPENFPPSFRYVTDYLRDRLGTLVVGIDLNYNRSSAGPDGIKDFERLYPGDRYVDIVTVSTYNRCGAGPYHTTQQSFTAGFQKAYAALDFVDKPLGIAEISTTSLCDPDKIAWFEDMMRSLKSDLSQAGQFSVMIQERRMSRYLWALVMCRVTSRRNSKYRCSQSWTGHISFPPESSSCRFRSLGS